MSKYVYTLSTLTCSARIDKRMLSVYDIYYILNIHRYRWSGEMPNVIFLKSKHSFSLYLSRHKRMPIEEGCSFKY